MKSKEHFPSLLFLLFVICSQNINAQIIPITGIEPQNFYCPAIEKDTTKVLMFVKPHIISEYQIILKQNGVFVKENYTHFKGKYWLGKTETIQLKSLIKTDSNYVDSKNKKIVYRYYGVCDSLINKIRNSASYENMMSEVDNSAEKSLGYDNRSLQGCITYYHLDKRVLSKTCYVEYKELETKCRAYYIACIDSAYVVKEENYYRIKADPTLIDQNYIDAFVTTLNCAPPDLRALEIIIINKPELFLNSINKLSENGFSAFSFKLNCFPEDVYLSEAKSTLKKALTKSARKKKILKKMKNKKN